MKKDQTKEPPSSEKITAWSYDMQEHAEKSEEICCELVNQTASSLQLVATPCIDSVACRHTPLQRYALPIKGGVNVIPSQCYFFFLVVFMR